MFASPSWDLVVMAVLGTLPLGYAWRQTQGTTLRAPVAWTWLAWIGLLLGEWLARQAAPGPAAAWRQIAAVGTFCPAMAILGAKRPQDHGWQFIVASLWLVLALPALQMLAFSPTGLLDPHPAWRGLHVLLLVVAASNYLPTRFALPSLVVAFVQWRLLRIPAPGETWSWHDRPPVLFGVLLTVLIATTLRVRSTAPPRATGRFGWDRVWIDFRNAFGCVWALRVAERINHAARLVDSPLELTWHGFARVKKETGANLPKAADDEEVRPEELAALEVTALQMLRRFVSPAWIDARLGTPAVDPASSGIRSGQRFE